MNLNQLSKLISWLDERRYDIHFRDALNQPIDASNGTIFLPIYARTIYTQELMDMGASWDPEIGCWVLRV